MSCLITVCNFHFFDELTILTRIANPLENAHSIKIKAQNRILIYVLQLQRNGMLRVKAGYGLDNLQHCNI